MEKVFRLSDSNNYYCLIKKEIKEGKKWMWYGFLQTAIIPLFINREFFKDGFDLCCFILISVSLIFTLFILFVSYIGIWVWPRRYAESISFDGNQTLSVSFIKHKGRRKSDIRCKISELKRMNRDFVDKVDCIYLKSKNIDIFVPYECFEFSDELKELLYSIEEVEDEKNTDKKGRQLK